MVRKIGGCVKENKKRKGRRRKKGEGFRRKKQSLGIAACFCSTWEKKRSERQGSGDGREHKDHPQCTETAKRETNENNTKKTR